MYRPVKGLGINYKYWIMTNNKPPPNVQDNRYSYGKEKIRAAIKFVNSSVHSEG
jgi:hypothetical protein